MRLVSSSRDLITTADPLGLTSWAQTLLLAQPARNPRHRLSHVVRRARIGEAHKTSPMDGIEVDAGGCRDMRFFQHALGKVETVGGEFGDVGIEVEGAV